MALNGPCFFGIYYGNILPDEVSLPECEKWERMTTGSPFVSVFSDVLADDGWALQIQDSAHSEACRFYRETSFLSGPYSTNTAKLTAKLRIDTPSGAAEFQGGTLGTFLEIDDGVSRIYMCLLNPDFAGGADPEVGIAGAGALNQYGTYQSHIMYWDDGAYHTFELTRNSDGSATLIIDGDTSNPLNVSKGSLQPTSGIPGFSFGAANGGQSTSYWDSVEWSVVSEEVMPVAIDIKPFSRNNIIRLRKWGIIPVAIFSSEDFDATNDIDIPSLTFGRTGDEQSLAFWQEWWYLDLNHDGFKDQICYFWTRKTNFRIGDTEGILKGTRTDGVLIEGCDEVKIKRW